MTTFYKWTAGSRINVDAQAAGEALKTLSEKLGHAPSSLDIVKAAKPANHVLHTAFEWDDKKAGHRWRMEQAGEIRRSLLEYIEPEGANEPVEFRVYDYVDKALDAGVERVWKRTEEIMANADDRELLIARAKREADSFRRRYAHLKELADVFAAMERAFEPETAH